MRRPVGVVDVRVVPVCEEAAEGGCEGDEGQDGAAGGHDRFFSLMILESRLDM